jgi:hypothetical protein
VSEERPEATEAFTVAIGLSTDDAARAYLQSRLTALRDDWRPSLPKERIYDVFSTAS